MQQQRSNLQILTFVVILSFVCAVILATLSSALQKPKEVAKELDQSKQMMIAAHIMNHEGYFLVEDKDGKTVKAEAKPDGILVADEKATPATEKEILTVYKKRFIPLLTDSKGQIQTFKEAGINLEDYIASNKKRGYYREREKLFYKILPNSDTKDPKPIGYIIPVNGYGLWDAIYGYLAIKPDGNTVIGTSWYDQKETPGLGANIAEAYWQNLFPGKKIFQSGPSGDVDFKTSPVGIIVVKGKVNEVLGDVPKAKSAVDGMAGATLTGNGVTDAYRDVLSAYRPFLIQIHNKVEKAS